MIGSFSALGLDDEIVKELQAQKFLKPTPVQNAAIPQLLSNRDVVVEACTGSGKTLAYLLPTIQILVRTKGERTSPSQIGALILSPTRELAIQIENAAKSFCKAVGLGSKVLTSGVDKNTRNKDEFFDNGSLDLVVGTPGRIDEWSETHRSQFKTLEVLIFDEADSLLSMGFQMSVQSILSRLPKQRRTGLFSATQAEEVQTLVRAGLRNPATIKVKVLNTTSNLATTNQGEPVYQKTPNRLCNFFKVLEADEKLQFIHDFIVSNEKFKMIIFFATCASVDYFGESILKQLFPTRLFTLHGKMNAKRRALTFQSFQKVDEGILVCTDIAARGIDLPDVDWIIQMDAPKEPDFFIHRVGRTARAGKSGSALLLLLPNEFPYVEYLLSQKVPITKFELEIPSTETQVSKVARKYIFSDRDILEKGTRAFVAYVGYYSEHRLSYLFRLTEVNFLKLIHAFHLLRLPKLKEFKNEKIKAYLKEFQEEPEEVVSKIKFKQKAREERRQKLLLNGKTFNEEKRLKKMNLNPQKKLNKKTSNVGEHSAGDEGTDNNHNIRKRKGKHEKILDEWKELQQEQQMYRKLKKGKLSAKEYEKALLNEL